MNKDLFEKMEKELEEVIDGALSPIRSQQARIKELEAAQTARVMTLEEIRERDFVWIEVRGEGIEVWQRCRLTIPIAPFDMAFKLLGRKEKRCFDTDDYGKTWRCWTSRPTDEQREAVKWE